MNQQRLKTSAFVSLACTAVASSSAALADVAKPLASELSPLGMFLQADVIVKMVMIGLGIASVVAWTVLIAKKIEIARVRRQLRHAMATITASETLASAARNAGNSGSLCASLTQSAVEEMRQTEPGSDLSSVKERIALRLSRVESGFARTLSVGMSVLATIGATSPFVGLFGTVWGIMNSFIGISKAQTTNLAVVAPGIAEALLATAIGLVAAIPAVIFYNHLGRSVNGVRALVGDLSTRILILSMRDLERSRSGASGSRVVRLASE